jgi:hypothetical protein
MPSKVTRGFELSDPGRTFDASHARHLDIHENAVQDVTAFDCRIACLDILQCFYAVVRNCDDTARARELSPQESLIHLIVFREEDVQAL